MTLDETRMILSVLRLNYPSTFKNMSKQDSINYLNLWHEMFKNDDYNLVKAAILAIIKTDDREFAPNIAQVTNKMYELTHPDEISRQEAWNLVKKALSRSIYHSVEEYQKLPPMLQKLVGSAQQLFEWAQMDSSTLDSVVASNFMKAYETRFKSYKEFDLLPNDVKQLISINIKQIE